MLVIKNNVKISGLKEEALWALDQATGIFKSHGKDCVLTAGRDKGHGDYSHHYKGLAVDLRSRHLRSIGEKKEVLGSLKAILGHEYQVIFENEGKPQEHFHIEYDPRQL